MTWNESSSRVALVDGIPKVQAMGKPDWIKKIAHSLSFHAIHSR